MPCPLNKSCEWSEHGDKHLPKRGVKREQTRRGPAKYLPGTTAAVARQIEELTVALPDATDVRGTKRHYFRTAEAVIGWDLGQDAANSFVECSGGEVGGRAFHGRPMHPSNPKWRVLQ